MKTLLKSAATAALITGFPNPSFEAGEHLFFNPGVS